MENIEAVSPLLSLVIATRNRSLYATSAILNILEIQDPRLELVVQDNSDNFKLKDWIDASISDFRLKYHYTPEPLSFIHNFDEAAKLASGEYVCFIGDDDGVNPEIMDAVDWAKSLELDALTIRQTASYAWPNSGIPKTLFSKKTDGVLSIKSIHGRIYYADVKKQLVHLLQNGGLYYLDHDLPKLYHGLVNRRCLNAIYERSGSYFGGLSPDTFASLALSCIASKLAITDYPLTIPGACIVSGSVVEGQIKKHSTKIEEAPHLRNRGDYSWSPLVPRIYTVETIWVDSSLAALSAMNRTDLIQFLNIPKLAAHCIGSNKHVTNLVIREMLSGLKINGENRVIGLFRLFIGLISGPGCKFTARIWNRFLLLLGKRKIDRIYEIENIFEASHCLSEYLSTKNISFRDCIRRNR